MYEDLLVTSVWMLDACQFWGYGDVFYMSVWMFVSYECMEEMSEWSLKSGSIIET